jgi:NitT/TauT family transport system permease protein
MTVLGSLGLAVGRGAIALAIAAAIWSVSAGALGPQYIPDLPTVVGRLVALLASADFWPDAWHTLRRLILGYGAGVLVGIPLGLVLAEVQPLRFIAGALINGMAAIPLLALAPLMVFWFGINDGSKIALTFAVTVFPVMSDIMSGLARGAPGGVAPAEAPNTARCVLATLRRGLVLAVAAELIGEMIASTNGLGYQMLTSMALFDVPRLAAITLFVALPCAFAVSLIRWTEETLA